MYRDFEQGLAGLVAVGTFGAQFVMAVGWRPHLKNSTLGSFCAFHVWEKIASGCGKVRLR